jgi:hypothetical protein
MNFYHFVLYRINKMNYLVEIFDLIGKLTEINDEFSKLTQENNENISFLKRIENIDILTILNEHFQEITKIMNLIKEEKSLSEKLQTTTEQSDFDKLFKDATDLKNRIMTEYKTLINQLNQKFTSNEIFNQANREQKRIFELIFKDPDTQNELKDKLRHSIPI